MSQAQAIGLEFLIPEELELFGPEQHVALRFNAMGVQMQPDQAGNLMLILVAPMPAVFQALTRKVVAANQAKLHAEIQGALKGGSMRIIVKRDALAAEVELAFKNMENTMAEQARERLSGLFGSSEEAPGGADTSTDTSDAPKSWTLP